MSRLWILVSEAVRKFQDHEDGFPKAFKRVRGRVPADLDLDT